MKHQPYLFKFANFTATQKLLLICELVCVVVSPVSLSSPIITPELNLCGNVFLKNALLLWLCIWKLVGNKNVDRRQVSPGWAQESFYSSTALISILQHMTSLRLLLLRVEFPFFFFYITPVTMLSFSTAVTEDVSNLITQSCCSFHVLIFKAFSAGLCSQTKIKYCTVRAESDDNK